MGDTGTLVRSGRKVAARRVVAAWRVVVAWLVLAVVIAVCSVGLALIGTPAPSMFGGLIGALVFALVRPGVIGLPTPLSAASMATIGAAIATQVDPAGFVAMGSHWPVIAGVVVATVVVSLAVGQLLRLHRVSFTTAFFASVAGGASGMTALAQELRADTRVVVVAQYLRVLAVLLTLPVVVALVFHPSGIGGQALTYAPATPGDYLFIALAIAIGLGARRFARVPAPVVLGGMVAGFLLMLAPSFREAQAPQAVRDLAFTLVGVQAGLKFTYEGVRRVARMLPTIVVQLVLLIAGCGLLGLLLSRVTGEDPLDCYLATSPGGIPVALATVSDTQGNVTLVSTTQVLRIVLVVVAAPIVASLWTRVPSGRARSRPSSEPASLRQRDEGLK